MAPRERVIAASDALPERGTGIRFEIERDGRLLPAFAIRVDGTVRAYLNACAHQGLELDWNPCHFFDREARYLVCEAHGAVYEPTDGRCADGPCRGKGLVSLSIVERAGQVLLIE